MRIRPACPRDHQKVHETRQNANHVVTLTLACAEENQGPLGFRRRILRDLAIQAAPFSWFFRCPPASGGCQPQYGVFARPSRARAANSLGILTVDRVGVPPGGSIQTGHAQTDDEQIGQPDLGIVEKPAGEPAQGGPLPGVLRTTFLTTDEPAPFEITGPEGRSPFLIVCDHAGRLVPRSLGDLGLAPGDLVRHIAWDIGAGQVARRLGAALDAFTITQPYSRLVIDCNRKTTAADSIVTSSEGTVVPGNHGIDEAEAERRARAIFHPYHDRIRGELDRRHCLGLPTILVAVHSFTPLFMQVSRPWHAGVLYLRDGRQAVPLLRLLREEPNLVIGCNEPYRADEQSDFSIVEHGERRGIPYVELEIRQDLIAEPAGQAEWAERLARLLPLAAAEIPS
jgi:predicted N-formylglutamate amidohydrolase